MTFVERMRFWWFVSVGCSSQFACETTCVCAVNEWPGIFRNQQESLHPDRRELRAYFISRCLGCHRSFKMQNKVACGATFAWLLAFYAFVFAITYIFGELLRTWLCRNMSKSFAGIGTANIYLFIVFNVLDCHVWNQFPGKSPTKHQALPISWKSVICCMLEVVSMSGNAQGNVTALRSTVPLMKDRKSDKITLAHSVGLTECNISIVCSSRGNFVRSQEFRKYSS